MKGKLVPAAEHPREKTQDGIGPVLLRRALLAGPLALAIAIVGPGGDANAFDELMPTKIALIRFGGTPAAGKLFRLVSKAPNPPLFQLPSASPLGTGGTLTVRVGTGTLTCELPMQAFDGVEGWKELGRNPAGSAGYKYINRNAPAGAGGPCKVVLVKERVVRVVAKGTETLPVPVDKPPGNPAIEVTLALGTDNYCAEAPAPHFREKANRLIKAKDQGAPGSCPTLPTTTTTTSSTTTTTGASTTTTTTGGSTTTTTTTSTSTTTTTTIPPLPLDHYRVYTAIGPDAPTVDIVDQFQTQVVDLGNVAFFMVPVNKNTEEIIDPVTHLTCYDIPEGTFSASVTVSNQFDDLGFQILQVEKPDVLCVPTQKLSPPTPGPLLRDHYKCYEASGTPVNTAVTLSDQFESQPGVTVLHPILFCNPAGKNGEAISNEVDHLTCYATDPPGAAAGSVLIENQFHLGALLNVGPSTALCVPSQKLGFSTTTLPSTTSTTTSTTTTTTNPSGTTTTTSLSTTTTTTTSTTTSTTSGSSTTTTTILTFPHCDFAGAPACDGWCPFPDQACWPKMDGTGCYCQTITPPYDCFGVGGWPECNGACPPQQACVGTEFGFCECQGELF